MYFGKNGVTGGEFSVRDGIAHCQDPVKNSTGARVSSAGTALAVSLDRMKFKQIFTEETAPGKVEEIIKLQQECLKADQEQSSALQHFIVEKGEKGSGILTLSTPSPETAHPALLYPVHAALYALAYRNGFIKPGTNTLVLFFSERTVLSLAVESGSIVFARSFPDNDELASAIRFSSQSVYFVKQRDFLSIDTTVVISPEKEDAEKVKKGCGEGEKVEFIDISNYFSGNNLSKAELADMALAYGISLAAGIAELDKWRFGNRGKAAWKKKWLLARCAVLLLAAGPLIYAADIISNKVLIARIDKKAAAIAPMASRVSQIMSDVNIFKSFASRTGRKFIGPDICFEIFSALDKARGSDLYLTALAGNPYGTISVNGSAGSYPSMLAFIEHLSTSDKLSSSELIYANTTDSGSVEFQLILKYKFPMEFKGSKRDQEEQDQ